MFSDILLTVDFDRTLTAPDSSIPQRNLDAIRYFMENGGTFTVNTGRSVPMTKIFRDVVPVNAPLLLYNGSGAYDVNTGSMLFCHEIQADPWEIVHTCQKEFPDMIVEIQGLDAHYCFERNPMWEAFSANSGCAWAMAEPGHVFKPFLKFSLYGELRQKEVSGLFSGSPEEVARIDAAEKRIQELFGDRVEVFRSALRILDVHAKGVSKNRSALELKQRLGKKILVCIGDGENDVSMLNGADFAFCPSDAVVADRYKNVCPCGDGAVADVIYNALPKIISEKP